MIVAIARDFGEPGSSPLLCHRPWAGAGFTKVFRNLVGLTKSAYVSQQELVVNPHFASLVRCLNAL